MLATDVPYDVYFDADGSPLDGGKLFFGQPFQNPETNPITVYWDAAGTQPAAQPIRTLNGWPARNGTPAVVYAGGDYSLTVRDRRGRQVFYAPSSKQFSNDQVLQDELDALIANLTTTGDPTKGPGFLPFDQTLVSYAVGTLGRRVRDLGLMVNVPAGGADATSAINAAILLAFQSMSLQLLQNEVFSVEVSLEAGRDYSVLGTILIPNGIVLNLNGARLIGPDTTGISTAYSSGGTHMIRSARWTGTAIVPNNDAPDEVTYRVIAAGVKNGTIINSNCAFDLTNCNERCFIDGISISNCSAPFRLKNCFYLRIGSQVKCLVRNSSQAAGQPAVLLHGAAAHDMSLAIQLVGVSIGYECTATNSFSVEIFGSMEEGYAINSIGIRANNSYCQSWKVHAYVEGVRVGITTLGTGAFFGCSFTPGYFSSCEYSFKALSSSFRACTIDCSSIPDEGAGIRNLVDLQADNNDVRIRMPSKSRNTSQGVLPYPSNYLLGPGCVCEAASVWTQISNAQEQLGLGDGALVNKNSLAQLPFEGRQIVSVNNEVPFCTLAVAPTTITLDSLLVADASDIVIVNLLIQDFNGTYTFHGFVFGTTAYWLSVPGKTMTISANAGFKRFVVSGLNTSSYSVRGVIRHA